MQMSSQLGGEFQVYTCFAKSDGCPVNCSHDEHAPWLEHEESSPLQDDGFTPSLGTQLD